MPLGRLLGGSKAKKEDAKPGFKTTPDTVALVTGSSGFCGARLAEMLLERGASTVICFDIMVPSKELMERFEQTEKECKGKFIHRNGADGDLTSKEAVESAFSCVPKIDVVYHIAALVGPFHDKPMYHKVNVVGTQHVLDACKKYKVMRLVNSSSPSTRFDGGDVAGKREDELPFPDKYVATYAETKAEAERMVADANAPGEFHTISVAPHQVYGPHDGLFLPNLLSTMGNGRLRIFGKGDKMISVCFVDNYCHGLMCGADEIVDPKSPALAKFYIITDTTPVLFWEVINKAGMAMGFRDMYTKFHLPVGLLYTVAYICVLFTMLTGKKTKLTPFTVRMMTIHRYFSPELSKQDLKYEPLYSFDDSWQVTIEWFKKNWLPGYCEEFGHTLPSDDDKGEKSD